MEDVKYTGPLSQRKVLFIETQSSEKGLTMLRIWGFKKDGSIK